MERSRQQQLQDSKKRTSGYRTQSVNKLRY